MSGCISFSVISEGCLYATCDSSSVRKKMFFFLFYYVGGIFATYYTKHLLSSGVFPFPVMNGFLAAIRGAKMADPVVVNAELKQLNIIV